MTDQSQLYIDGEWTDASSGETVAVQNPAAPNEIVAEYQVGTEADVAVAVEAATAASDDWAATPAPERGALLRETAQRLASRTDELTELLVREEGKTRAEAGGEVQRAIDIFYYYAEKTRDLGGVQRAASGPRTSLYTVREPLGVVGLITPWNYPIAIPAWKLAPALATGNTAVLKPAFVAPGVAREIVVALDEAGLPDGVVNFVTGNGSTVGEAIVTHDDVDAVSFTGSGEVGMHVYDAATADGKRIQTEMGGKNVTLVTDSADVDEAADIVADGAFGVTGQACTATSRAVVHEAVYDEFIEAVVERAEAIELGPGLDDADMGPQVSESELEGTLEYVDIGVEEGATLETGGERASSVGDGYFIEPTVFSDVEREMRIAQEEIFGPVVSIIPYSDFDEGVEIANDSRYGLSASVVTNDHSQAKEFIDRAEVGVVKVNQKTTGLELNVPFGGTKRSSSETYREQGDAALKFYTITKTVYDEY